MTDAIRYLSVLLLILVSAFFSATEIAYSSANPTRLKAKRQNGEGVALKTAIKKTSDLEVKEVNIKMHIN